MDRPLGPVADGQPSVRVDTDNPAPLRRMVEGLFHVGLRAGYAPGDVTDVFVTHIHPDHYPLAGRIREASGARVRSRSGRRSVRPWPTWSTSTAVAASAMRIGYAVRPPSRRATLTWALVHVRVACWSSLPPQGSSITHSVAKPLPDASDAVNPRLPQLAENGSPGGRHPASRKVRAPQVRGTSFGRNPQPEERANRRHGEGKGMIVSIADPPTLGNCWPSWRRCGPRMPGFGACSASARRRTGSSARPQTPESNNRKGPSLREGCPWLEALLQG